MTISTKQTLNRGGTVIAKILLNIFFIALSVFSIYPVIWMIYSSLKTDSEQHLCVCDLCHFDRLPVFYCGVFYQPFPFPREKILVLFIYGRNDDSDPRIFGTAIHPVF